METYKGSCHCKQVLFSFKTSSILEDIYKCNCSLCAKKGIIMKAIPKDQFVVITGLDIDIPSNKNLERPSLYDGKIIQ